MKWRRHLLDFSGAAVASFSATVTDGIIYMILLWTLVDRGTLSVGVAAGCGAVVGGIVHYLLNRFWVFRRFHAPIAQSALTYFPMSWLAAVLHGLATEGFTQWVDPKLAWFCSKGIIWIAWTYPMSRFVVFGGIGRR
ncbi:MAG: GtrA family protein, partial [Bradymonadaceae bacterium]